MNGSPPIKLRTEIGCRRKGGLGGERVPRDRPNGRLNKKNKKRKKAKPRHFFKKHLGFRN